MPPKKTKKTRSRSRSRSRSRPKRKANVYLKCWNQAVKNVGITFEKGEFRKLPKKGTKRYLEIKKEYNRLLKEKL